MTLKPGSEPEVTDMAEDRLDFGPMTPLAFLYANMNEKQIQDANKILRLCSGFTMDQVERRLKIDCDKCIWKTHELRERKKVEAPDAEKG